MRHIKETVLDVLESWGWARQTTRGAKADRRLLVTIVRGADRVRVGTLAVEKSEFVFRYADAFKRQTAIPPISAFPDVDEEYRSSELWPFFTVRMPPTKRPDIEALLRDRGVQADDPIAVLGTLARKPVSAPFEFEMVGA